MVQQGKALICFSCWIYHVPYSSIFIQLTHKIPVNNLFFTSRMENSVGPDQLASLEKPADQDLHCFQNEIRSCFA